MFESFVILMLPMFFAFKKAQSKYLLLSDSPLAPFKKIFNYYHSFCKAQCMGSSSSVPFDFLLILKNF